MCYEKEVKENRKKGRERERERERDWNRELTRHVGKMKTSREEHVATTSETGSWTVMDL